MILGSGIFQITGKYYLMQVARHGAAGSFIPLTHVKLLINHNFGKTNIFYWQLLIILFAVDIAKKNGIIPLCASRREKYISGAAIFGAAAPPGAARSWLSYPTFYSFGGAVSHLLSEISSAGNSYKLFIFLLYSHCFRL